MSTRALLLPLYTFVFLFTCFYFHFNFFIIHYSYFTIIFITFSLFSFVFLYITTTKILNYFEKSCPFPIKTPPFNFFITLCLLLIYNFFDSKFFIHFFHLFHFLYFSIYTLFIFLLSLLTIYSFSFLFSIPLFVFLIYIWSLSSCAPGTIWMTDRFLGWPPANVWISFPFPPLAPFPSDR